MIRTEVTSDKNSVVKLLPDNNIEKQIEIIPFTLKEPVEQTHRTSAKKVFTVFKIDTIGYKFNRDEANER